MNSFVDAQIVGVGVDPKDYHQQKEQRGSPGFVMSRSEILDFSKNPAKWRKGVRDEQTDSTLFGSLVDCLVLSPDEFDCRFAVCPETYTNKEGKQVAWRNDKRIAEVAAWIEANQSKTIIKTEMLECAKVAASRLTEDPKVSALIEVSQTQVYLCGFYADDATGIRVPVKALIDLLPFKDSPFQAVIADLKTARDGSPERWARVCFEHGYHVQAAWFLDIYNAAANSDRTDWLHVIVENTPPFEIGRRILEPEFIGLGRQIYQNALRDYCQCLKAGEWPGYDDRGDTRHGWGWTYVEAWMIGKDSGVSGLAMQSEKAIASW